MWFSELRAFRPMEPIPASDIDDRDIIRAYWDDVEQKIRVYLVEDLYDDMLFSKPITEPDEDKDLIAWQVLIHVANHATDHRAQLLRVLHDLGVETKSQDYIFYIFDNQM